MSEQFRSLKKKKMAEQFTSYWVDTIRHRQNISQTFADLFNLPCDLDLQHSNPTFPQDTQAYNAVLSNQIWSQTDQQFRR